MQKFIKFGLFTGILGMLVFGIISNISAATDLFSDGFETGFSSWSTPVGSKWASSNTAYSGSKSARVKGEVEDSVLKKTNIDTTGFENISVSFWYKAGGSLDSSDTVKTEYTLDGSNWVTFFTIDNSNDTNSEQNDGWNNVSQILPEGASNNPNFGIRFLANLDAENDEVKFDEVNVTGDQIAIEVPEEIKTTIVMTKVVCTHESDLPNWGNGGPDITSTTATDWVNSHPGCYLASDFSFEWALYTAANPGDNLETGGSGWTTFGATMNNGVTSTEVTGQEPLWIREKVSPYYLGFSGALTGVDDMDSTESKYSAELYCQNDVLNYDNYDYIEQPTKSDTVHCVAFNYEIDSCPNIEGEQLGVPNGMHKVNGACVPETSTVNVCKVDQNQNNLSGWTVMLKGESVQSGLNVPTNISSGVNTNLLLSGLSYIFKSAGTWLNQGGANPVDTEYSTTDSWATQMDGYTGYQTDILELQINNSFDPDSVWGPYNSLHNYARSIIAPIDGPANLRIFDGSGTTQNEGWFGDNSGSLTVDINKGYAGVTGENGCVSFENVPYGTYAVDEIMQEGWENVSGLGDVQIDSQNETFTIVNQIISTKEPGRVRVSKFIDGVKATSLMTTSIHFPIYSITEALWFNLDNDGHREGDVPYQASTLVLPGGSVYELNEELATATVGASCGELKPFHTDQYKPYALVGYSVGKTYEEAVSASITPTLDPIVVDGDVHVIVHNTKCNNPEPEPENPPQVCTEKTMTVVSDTNDSVDSGTTSILSFIHTGWSSISGANWIWNVDGVSNPTQDEFVNFAKSFTIPGTPLSAVLEVLVDNSYSGSLNTFTTIGDSTENNFGAIDTYNIPDTDLINGTNILSFSVKNWALAGSTPQTNPAGLAYKLTVNYEECTPVDEEPEPEAPVNNVPVIVLNGDASIILNVGDAYSELGAVANDTEDGNNLPVTNITGTVDTNVPGNYQVTYNYIDSGALPAVAVIRNITVNALPEQPEQPEEPEDEDDEEDNNPPQNPPTNNGGGGGSVPIAFLGNFSAPVTTGQVLGESTTCGIYLDKFLRKGYKNDPESVKKIQKFLNDYLKSNLPITGFFGTLTDAEVKKFQWMHKDSILTPWKLNSPTGIVYLTTTKKINEIMCPELNLANPELVPFEQNPDSPKL